MDIGRVKAEAVYIRPPEGLNSIGRLKEAIDRLLEQLTSIADVAVPKRKLSQGRRAD